MNFFINPNTIKKNGESTVYIVCHLKKKTVQINTRVSVDPNKFDLKKGCIKGNSKDVEDKNLILSNCYSQLNDIFVRYRLQNRDLTPDLLVQEYKNPSLYVDFYDFMDKEIAARLKKKEITPGTYKHHLTTLNKLKRFKKCLSFSEINAKLINSFSAWLRTSEKNSVNTIHQQLKNWKAYLQIAVRDDIIKTNPFENVRLSKIDTQRLFLTESELKKLFAIYETTQLRTFENRTLRHFLFMCLTGLRISDLSTVKKDQIRDNRLYYVPVKTTNKKTNEIKVLLQAKAIQLTEDENSTTDFLFNCISDQKMNSQLKAIAKKTELGKEITNHTARHTFATLFVEKTKDVASLQKLLGHSRLEETMKYVHLSQTGIDDQMKYFESLLNI